MANFSRFKICCIRSKFEFGNPNSIFRKKWRTIDVLGIWTNLLKVEVYEISFVNQKLDLVSFYSWFPKVFKYSYIHTLLHKFDPFFSSRGHFLFKKNSFGGKVFTINFHLKGHILYLSFYHQKQKFNIHKKRFKHFWKTCVSLVISAKLISLQKSEIKKADQKPNLEKTYKSN